MISRNFSHDRTRRINGLDAEEGTSRFEARLHLYFTIVGGLFEYRLKYIASKEIDHALFIDDNNPHRDVSTRTFLHRYTQTHIFPL